MPNTFKSQKFFVKPPRLTQIKTLQRPMANAIGLDDRLSCLGQDGTVIGQHIGAFANGLVVELFTVLNESDQLGLKMNLHESLVALNGTRVKSPLWHFLPSKACRTRRPHSPISWDDRS